MSPPMVLGADAPFVLRGVLSLLTPICKCRDNVPARPDTAAPCGHRPTTSVRGYRAPLFEALPHVDPNEIRTMVVASVAGLGLTEKVLGRIAVALRALENYYLAIGARWDARRMADMRWPVDELLGDFSREHEAKARFRHATMWMGAWNKALWALQAPRPDQKGDE